MDEKAKPRSPRLLAIVTLAVLAVAGCASTVTRTVRVAIHPTARHTQPHHARLHHRRRLSARYCQDGQCITVPCPPPHASEAWICAVSSNSAARRAVAHIAPPPTQCPTGFRAQTGGGCVYPSGYCPEPLVPNPYGYMVCPGASLAQQPIRK
jgi:hypothetical protein